MKSNLTKLSFALLSAVFILGCQDLGSDAVGPDGLVPQFAKKEGKGKGKPPSGVVPARLTLGDGMAVSGLGLEVTGKNDDSHVVLSTGTGNFGVELSWGFPADCVVVVGANGNLGAAPLEGEEDFLVNQLTNAVGSGKFGLDVDKTAFVDGVATNQLLLWQYDYDGDVAQFQGVSFRLVFRSFSSDFADPKVTWDGGNDFVFTGPIMVIAFNMDGRSGKRGRRAISCGGNLDNKVTVTVNPSP